MTEDWVVKNRISPVKYIYENSPDTEFLNELLKQDNKINLGYAKIKAKEFISTYVDYKYYCQKEWRAVAFEESIELLGFTFEDITRIVFWPDNGGEGEREKEKIANLLEKKFKIDKQLANSKISSLKD